MSYSKSYTCKFMQASSWHRKLFHVHLFFWISKVWKGRGKIKIKNEKSFLDEIKVKNYHLVKNFIESINQSINQSISISQNNIFSNIKWLPIYLQQLSMLWMLLKITIWLKVVTFILIFSYAEVMISSFIFKLFYCI